jgi:hypothetical protein
MRGVFAIARYGFEDPDPALFAAFAAFAAFSVIVGFVLWPRRAQAGGEQVSSD